LEFQFTYKTPQDPNPAGTGACQIVFGACTRAHNETVFSIHTELPLVPSAGLVADTTSEYIEANTSAMRCQSGVIGTARFFHTDSWALVEINSHAHTAAGDLADITYEAYLQLFACFKQLGFGHVVRMWNYLGDINKGAGDNETYKQFCYGRQRAFSELAIASAQFPAASALGRRSGGLQVYALATRAPCVHIENPVQTSAYYYPREFGPASPSFARATLAGEGAHTLFISGTASILNAQSHYSGDVVKQARLSCENVQRVMAQAQQSVGAPFVLRLVKVYVRYAQDRAEVETLLQQLLGAQCAFLWLQADICRAELLIEIEGIAVRA
jgi:chorismate lyase / 3-hydroxybenzoate synthase